MSSAIDPTKPEDGIPASKNDLRQNLQVAKDEIEVLQLSKEQELTGTALTVDAALIGQAATLLVRCTSGSAITITLAADVPVGKGAHIVRWGDGNVTVQAGASAFTRKVAAASLSTSEQYDSLVIVVARNNGGSAAEWLVI